MEHAKALKVTAGTEPDAHLGPVISKQVHSWISILSIIIPANSQGEEPEFMDLF